ncbi:MAG: ABC transporter substrate-binding protein [Myxococcales bacterium]
MRHLPKIFALCVLILSTHARRASAGEEGPGTAKDVVAAAEKEGKLSVYSTTDAALVAPLLKDFAKLHPKITLEYNDMNSTELYNRVISEAAAGSGSGDFVWSSAMDLQIKLANDAYAQAYESPETPHLPQWANWRNEAFATTFEPIAFAYNKRLLKPEEVPQSHAELTRALAANPERWRGKLTSYDPERSGIGFLLITQDARLDPNFAATERAYGAVGVKLYTSAGAMLERIGSGEHLLGFNIFGSYATARQRKDPSIGIVYPKDYTLVMSRIALIPKAAKHPNAAKLFLDYLLSKRGQELIANAALFSIRDDVEGATTAAALTKQLGGTLKPMPVGPSLLVYLDQAKRLEFLKQWQQALGTK